MTQQEALKELENLTIDYGKRTEEEIGRLDEAVDMAIAALRADAVDRQTCEDAVSRQAAIDAMEGLPKYFDKTDTLCLDYADVLAVLSEHLPSVQSEKRTEERTETHACDCVSRQAAIDCVTYDEEYTIECLKALPSAQPETAKRIVGKSRDGMTLWYQCDMCNEPVDAQDNFCRGCGRRLTDG